MLKDVKNILKVGGLKIAFHTDKCALTTYKKNKDTKSLKSTIYHFGLWRLFSNAYLSNLQKEKEINRKTQKG